MDMFMEQLPTCDFKAIPILFIIVPDLRIVIMDQKQMPPKDLELEPILIYVHVLCSWQHTYNIIL